MLLCHCIWWVVRVVFMEMNAMRCEVLIELPARGGQSVDDLGLAVDFLPDCGGEYRWRALELWLHGNNSILCRVA